MTLVELLVVIVILVTLVAAAIPLVSPTNDGRRLREASRGVNAFITGAQMRAIATQRPYGVAIKRLSRDTNTGTNPIHDDNAVSIELYYVEQPSPFVGFDESSAVRVALYTPANATLYGGLRPLVLIQFVARGNNLDRATDGLPPGWDPDSIPPGVIRPSDVIEINGTHYMLHSDTDDSNVVPRFTDATNTFFASNTGKVGGNPNKATQIVGRPLNDSGQLINVVHDDHGFEIGTSAASNEPFFTNPSRYKILRQPVPTSDQPYQLPDGTAVDLRASGIGNERLFYFPGDVSSADKRVNNAEDIVVMFAPEGAVSRLMFNHQPGKNGIYDERPVQNLYLLVGKRENAPPPPVAGDPTLDTSKLPAPGAPNREQQLLEMKQPINWLRGESRWIVIGTQSGRVVTVENAFVDPRAVINKYVSGTVPERTEAMRNSQIIEARQFARDMTQVGGR